MTRVVPSNLLHGIVDSTVEPKHQKISDIESNEVKTQLQEGRAILATSEEHQQRLKNKLGEAEVFAAVVKRSDQRLETFIKGLKARATSNPIVNQKLLAVLEGVESDLQWVEKIDAEISNALKTVNLAVERREKLFEQVEKTLDEFDSSRILEPLDNLALISEGLQECKEGQTADSTSTLLFSRSAALEALQSLREQLSVELKANQTELGANQRLNPPVVRKTKGVTGINNH